MQIIDLLHLDLESWHDPRTLIVYTTQRLGSTFIHDIHTRFPDLTIVGVSSFHGVLLNEGYKRGIFGLLFEGSDGLEVHATAIDLKHSTDIRSDVCKHLKNWPIGRDFDPAFFMHATMGIEERVLEGIYDAFPSNPHVFGGTAANDTFLPEAFVFVNDTLLNVGAIIISVPQKRVISFMRCGGYLATLKKGIVTRSTGRIVESIDGMPAVDVFNRWTDGMFEPYLKRGGILPRSIALYPLGRSMGNSTDDHGRWLAEAYYADARDKSLYFCAETPTGTEVQLMRGTEESIINNAKNAIQWVLEQVDISKVLVGLIVFCSGCSSVIADKMGQACNLASNTFGEIPFIGCTTQGEQGRLDGDDKDYHGNMMLGIALLLK